MVADKLMWNDSLSVRYWLFTYTTLQHATDMCCCCQWLELPSITSVADWSQIRSNLSTLTLTHHPLPPCKVPRVYWRTVPDSPCQPHLNMPAGERELCCYDTCQPVSITDKAMVDWVGYSQNRPYVIPSEGITLADESSLICQHSTWSPLTLVHWADSDL